MSHKCHFAFSLERVLSKITHGAGALEDEVLSEVIPYVWPLLRHVRMSSITGFIIINQNIISTSFQNQNSKNCVSKFHLRVFLKENGETNILFPKTSDFCVMYI